MEFFLRVHPVKTSAGKYQAMYVISANPFKEPNELTPLRDTEAEMADDVRDLVTTHVS